MARDAKVEGYYDLRSIEAGEPCPKCSAPLKISNAIELGHIFKLGTKYSDTLNITYLDESGKAQPVIMGSYGIGMERIIACYIEQNYDKDGIIWNKALAPYQIHLIAVNMNSKDVVAASDRIYTQLSKVGVDIL